MSESSKSIWGDDAPVFEWGSFSVPEEKKLRDEHENRGIVLNIPEHSSHLARRVLGWFTLYFLAMQVRGMIDPGLRIVACYVDDSVAAGCNAVAFSLEKSLECEQPTYAIHVNIHSIPALASQGQRVASALQHHFSQGVTPNSDGSGGAPNTTAIALAFVFFHELAHILRGHLEWTPAIDMECDKLSNEGRKERRMLELDADNASAGYCGSLIRDVLKWNDLGEEPSNKLLQGSILVVALYTALSAIREGSSSSEKCRCYYSSMGRLKVVISGLFEKMELPMEMAASLVMLLSAGLKRTVQQNVSMSTILDFTPALHASEDFELTAITVPRLVQLTEQGRLQGWLKR